MVRFIVVTIYFLSGGIDRTGLFIAMETALVKIEIVEAVNSLEIVREMRNQRGMMLPSIVSILLE